MLTIHTIIGAPLETNAYFLADADAGEAVLVDAPAQIADEVVRLADELCVTVRMIICTHGHFDHVMGLPELLAVTHAPVACHALDAEMLEHPPSISFLPQLQLTPVSVDIDLQEGYRVAIGAHHFEVLHTPGHTPGSICLYAENDHLLFSGDTLFAGTCGRVDFPGGDAEAMVKSLLRLSTLPAETRVFPGHGGETSIGREGWLATAGEYIG